MAENEIYEELAELKESFDKIFEYLPASETADTDQQKEIPSQEIQNSNSNQPQTQQQQQPQNQKHSQQKEKSIKPWQSVNQKYRSKQITPKIRPGFEGPKIIRTKRQTK